MSLEVASIGETMLRLAARPGERLARASALAVHVGGAESNTLAALASLGRSVGWAGAVPDSPLGELVLWTLRGAGVDVSRAARVAGARQGLYFVEFGSPPRPIEVLYDRRGSAASELEVGAVAWDYLLSARLVHLTGITPALGRPARAVSEAALERARERGVPVCFDVNHRARLWSAADAGAWVDRHARGLEVFLCGRADAEALFGTVGEERALEALVERFGARFTVLTLGSSGALAALGSERVRVAPVAATVVDRLGAGDAFAAGVIDGWLDGDVAAGLERGAVLAALALSQEGDLLTTDRAEMARLLGGVSSATQVRR